MKMKLSISRQSEYRELFNITRFSPLAVLQDNELILITNAKVMRIPVDLNIPNGNRILLKLEHLSETSPTGSLYDRLYSHLFLRAEKSGFIKPGITPVIEASIGNAGAAFARVAHHLGYKNPLVLLPSDTYPARIKQIRDLGAQVVFSPPKIGPIGYVNLLENILTEDWRLKGKLGRDHSRLYPISKIRKIPSEPYEALVCEVVGQLNTSGFSPKIDTFVFGVGSGNALSQIGLAVKRINSNAQIFVCEHEEKPFVDLLLRGEEILPDNELPDPEYPATAIHGVPLSKLNLDLGVIDNTILIPRYKFDEGLYIANRILKLCAGIPSGLVLMSGLEIAQRVENKNILTVIFDHLGKYGKSNIYIPTSLKDIFNIPEILFHHVAA